MVTPAAGYVSMSSACLIGIIAGAVCFFAVSLKNRLGWDDALDVWGVHGVGGTIGVILTGVFASTAINASAANGLIYGGVDFFLKETIAVLGASIYAFVFSYAMLALINLFTKVRVHEDHEEAVDEVIHGETAYL